MSRKPLQYYLFSANRKPLYVDPSGHVVEGNATGYTKADGQPAHLEYDPQGWAEALVKYARNDRYHGVWRSYTQALRFVGDGARILRNRMWTQGVEGVVYMGILRLDLLSLPYQYRPEYVSELNMAKYSETETAVTVEALEGGLSKLLKAYEGTTYDIPLEGPEVQTAQVDGLKIAYSADLMAPAFNYDAVTATAKNVEKTYVVGASKISSELSTVNLTVVDTTISEIDTTDYSQSEDWFIRAEDSVSIELTLNFSFRIEKSSEANSGNGGHAWLRLVKQDGTVVKQLASESFGSADFFRSYQVSETLTVPLLAGDRLFLVAQVEITAGLGNFQKCWVVLRLEESTLLVRYKTRYRTTYIMGYYLMDLLEKLVRKMSGGLYGARSAWLAAKKDILITSGDAVRGLKKPVIKVSLTDLFQILSFFSVGMGVEGDTLVVEPVAYFYQSSVITDLGEVSAATLDVAEDKLFTTLKVGADEQELDDVNGRYAFAQPQQWTTPATRNPREWDLTMPAMVDPYAIEQLRINLEGKTTTGDSGDNQVVLLHVRPEAAFTAQVEFIRRSLVFSRFNFIKFSTNTYRDRFSEGMSFTVAGTALNNGTYKALAILDSAAGGFSLMVGEEVENETVSALLDTHLHRLYRDPSVVIEGLPDPATVFNLIFRPKNGLLNNGALIRSALDYLDSGVLKLQSATRNAEIATTVAGVTLREKDDVQIGALPARLYRPYLLKVKAAAARHALTLIKANPYGRVQFTWNDRTWQGFLTDGGVRLSDGAEQEWVLLSAPENDLSKFNAV